MPRIPRLVVPGLPHHVTQRGVRSVEIFTDDADRERYLSYLALEGVRWRLRYLAWCLMGNHVHLIVVPGKADSIARGIGEAHKRYTRERNSREGVRGHLFQGRFDSCVLDKRQLVAAVRFVELTPVTADVVDTPAAYAWSSARFHLGKRRADPLVEDGTLCGLLPTKRAWRELLAGGLDELEAKRIEKHLATGRPSGSGRFVKGLERRTGRVLVARKGGWPKGRPRRRRAGGN